MNFQKLKHNLTIPTEQADTVAPFLHAKLNSPSSHVLVSLNPCKEQQTWLVALESTIQELIESVTKQA